MVARHLEHSTFTYCTRPFENEEPQTVKNMTKSLRDSWLSNARGGKRGGVGTKVLSFLSQWILLHLLPLPCKNSPCIFKYS
jgi:hypothetical protein